MSKVDMFLSLDGTRQGAVKGECQELGHTGEIEISGWSWGMASQVHTASQVASKASIRAIVISKSIDSSSTAIMSALRSAEVIKTAVITCRDPGGAMTLDYLRITLRHVRINDYDIRAGAGEGERQVHEQFTLAFKEIEFAYSPKSAANSKAGVCTFVNVHE